MLQLCFGFTDSTGTYYKHALVTLISVFEHTSSKITVHFFIDDTCTEEKKLQFLEICERYGQIIIFYEMADIPQEIVDSVPPAFGKGTLFRLFIPELIHADKVLYIDCDIVCLLDIQELFDIDICDACLGGAPDKGFEIDQGVRENLEKIGVPPSHYINAGVLLINTKKIRYDFPDFRNNALSLIAEHKLAYADQDAINLLFPKRTLLYPDPSEDTTSLEPYSTSMDQPESIESSGLRKNLGEMDGTIGLLPQKYNFCINAPGENAYCPFSFYITRSINC